MNSQVRYDLKPEPLAYHGLWALTLVRWIWEGSSVTQQALYFDRLFKSEEEAIAFGQGWLETCG